LTDGDVLICKSPKELTETLETLMRIYRKRLEENNENELEQYLGIMVWGGIGIGKSMIVKQTTRKIYGQNATVIDLRGSLLEPSDIMGIPTVIENATRWNPPSLFPRAGCGVIFLDEINLAPISVQHALYQLILNRRIGEYKVPKTFLIIAAGNERTHRAHVYEMPSALLNRLLHIKILEPAEENLNLTDWVDDWTEYMASKDRDRRVIVYNNQFKQRLYTFDPKKVERSYATPRTWEEISINIKGIEDLKTVERLTAMAVGQGIANEFVAWIKISEEFDTEKYLKDPESLDFERLPVDKKYALVLALANTIIPKYEKKVSSTLTENVVEILSKLDVEFRVLMIRLLKASSKVKNRLIACPEFSKKLGKTLDYL